MLTSASYVMLRLGNRPRCRGRPTLVNPAAGDQKVEIGRNDPCWCGSGKKYKRCHLDRERESPLPLLALAGQLRRFFRLKQCLHPHASRSTCGRVIAAHTIQRQGALGKIVDGTGHCLSFYPPTGRDVVEPHRRGWREASTFAGFCDKHDASTFALLERIPFVGSREQCFLLAYRAECHELYQKQASDRSHHSLRQVIDRGMSPVDQVTVQEMQHWAGAGVRKGLAESRRFKAVMDQELLNGAFDSYRQLFVRFVGDLAIAGTGAPTPNRSLAGEERLRLHDPDAAIQRIYVGVVPADGGGAIVFVWRKGEFAPESFIGDLLALDSAKLASVIAQFLFAYIENTYFSSKWWGDLAEHEKTHVRALATMGNPYYTRWAYRELHTPWRITTVSEQWTSA